jgi:antitoxin component YwqK of YwqJK toxin-antitoxin module
MKINLKLIKVSCLFLMLGLSLHTYGQRRHHINQTFTKNGKFKENSVVYLIKDTTKINGLLFSDERIKFEIEFKDGQRNGIAKSWRADGTKKCFVNYESGKMNGSRKCWHDNERLWIDAFYTNGKNDGIKKIYYKSGVLKYEGRYIDGAPDGIHKSFYRSGSPKHQSNSVNGDFHGKYIEWYEYSQNIKSEWIYVNGKKHGQQKEFSSSGKLKSVEIYDNGKKITP